jgi:hypothetical protein
MKDPDQKSEFFRSPWKYQKKANLDWGAAPTQVGFFTLD